MKQKIIVSWSGGKDSALALYEIRKNKKYKIVSLLTTLTRDYNRVSMHGFRCELLEKQAAALNLPLEKVIISKNTTNESYERIMKKTLVKFSNMDVKAVVFGDIFLKDLRNYRVKNLAKIGMDALFPLWQKNTKKLVQKFINLNFKAIITCVDTEKLTESFAGRIIDSKQFLNDLPTNVDPCGENGEFHSFVYSAPVFEKPIPFEKSDLILREKRFCFCDLKLKS